MLLSPLFWLSCSGWVVAGAGIRLLRHWSWYVFIGAQLFTVYLNLQNLLHYSESSTKGLAFVSTLIIQFYVYLVVSRDLRVPYLFPRIKWWESGLAAMHNLPVEVYHASAPEGATKAHLLDLNIKGCFVKSPFEYGEFEKIKIKIEAYGQALDVAGEVVWHADSTVTHPKGIGVKFLEMDRPHKRRIRAVVRRFIKERDQANGRIIVST